MDDTVEVHLASIWLYREAGVERVLRDLQSLNLPAADYTFDDSTGWLKVTCRESDIFSIQKCFRSTHAVMEEDLRPEDVLSDDGSLRVDINNKWLRGALNSPTATAGLAGYRDYQCPSTFARFQSSRAWSRLDKEAALDLTATGVFNGGELDAISNSIGAFIRPSKNGKVLYIGASSAEKVDAVVRKLDTIFDYHRTKLHRARHVLYPGADAMYAVDARYLAHINPTLVKSTVFDPAGLSTAAIAAQYKALYFGVGLRICPYNQNRACFESFFGPPSTSVFSDQSRPWFSVFRDIRYAPKLSVIQPTKTQPVEPGAHQTVANKMDDVETWVAGLTKADAVPYTGVADQTCSTPAPRVAHVHGASNYSIAIANCAPQDIRHGRFGGEEAAITLSDSETTTFQERERGIQEKIARLELKLYEERQKLALPSMEAPVSSSGGHGAGHDVGARETVVWGQGTEAREVANADGKALLRGSKFSHRARWDPTPSQWNDGNEASPEFHSTMRQGAASRVAAASVALGPPRDSVAGDLARDLNEAFGPIASSMRIKVGRLFLRAELGRICMTDPVPGELAFNAPHEKADGWRPRDIAEKLNASDYPVFFTKILSNFGNDADYLAGLKDSGGIMWQHRRSRVVYDFACKRTLVDGLGQPRGYEDFVVEVDGTTENQFTYTIRSGDEDAHHVWIHCLRHNWDVRLVMSYVAAAKLEAIYGAFARSLVESLVVPRDTVRHPFVRLERSMHTLGDQKGVQFHTAVVAVRVRHIARYTSKDGRSLLDLTYLRDMDVQFPEGGEHDDSSRLEAFPMTEAVARGVFSSWYEASVSSVKAEEIFVENEGIATGDESQWDIGTLSAAGVLEALYTPALEMVRQMDGVGATVDNGQGGRYRAPAWNVRQAEARREAEASGGEFW